MENDGEGKTISYENLHLSCRICLNTDASEDIFCGDSSSILMKLLACSDIKISESDGLPRLICFSCLLRLNDAYNLRVQCENSNRLLQEIQHQRSIFKIESKDDDFDMAAADDADDDLCFTIKQEFDLPNDIKITRKAKRKSHRKSKENLKVKPKLKMCSFCGKGFRKKEILVRHIKIHFKHEEANYPCKVCGKNFSSRIALSKHEFYHKDQSYVCDECGKIFKNCYYITKHKRNVHSTMQHSCDICKKALKTKTSLKMHMLIHEEVKKYICPHCGQKFTHMQSLKGHVLTHTGTKPHGCKFCDSKFATLKSKIEHERLHTGQRPYQCPICSKAFAQKSNMKSHFVHNHKSEKWELHNPKSIRKYS